MTLTSLLASENWRPFFKPLAKILDSNDAAILFSELCNSHEYFKNRDQLTEDGWFFCTVDYLQEEINLSKHQQRRCVDLLQKASLIDTEKRGMPAQRYFKISDQAEQILKEMTSMVADKRLKNLPTGGQEIEPQEVKKPDSNEIIPNEILKRDHKKEEAAPTGPKQPDPKKKEDKPQRFDPAGLEDIAGELNRRGMIHDTTVNRQAAWVMLRGFIERRPEDFKNQWDFITMGLPEHNQQAVLQAWVVKGDWHQVCHMKLNKIRGWVEQEISRQTKAHHNGSHQSTTNEPTSNSWW